MKKAILFFGLLLTTFCLNQILAQNQPSLQTTFDWISGKVKAYAKRVGPPRETKNAYGFAHQTNSSNELVWSFEGDKEYNGQWKFWIYPLRVTSFEVADTYVQVNGTNVLKMFFVYDRDISDYEYRKDVAVIAMDMNSEENFVERMKKALTTFVSLKKKKAGSGEAF